jgi:hypothetical protein
MLLQLIIKYLNTASRLTARASWTDDIFDVVIDGNQIQITTMSENKITTITKNDKISIDEKGRLVITVGNYQMYVKFFTSVGYLNLLNVYRDLVLSFQDIKNSIGLDDDAFKIQHNVAQEHAEDITINIEPRESLNEHLVWGSPGQGKSKIMEEFCKEMFDTKGFTCITASPKLTTKEQYDRFRTFLFDNPNIRFMNKDSGLADWNITSTTITITDAYSSIHIDENTPLKVKSNKLIITIPQTGKTIKFSFIKIKKSNKAKDLFK